MTVYEVDPTTDRRWDDFLGQHSDASIFHTRGWLEALRQTYGYEPVAFTTSPPGRSLTNGILFCQTSSLLGSRRLISLPFSDHCAPLVESSGQLTCLLSALQKKLELENWSYIETRATASFMGSCSVFEKEQAFWFHKLDLRPTIDEIFQNFHRNCVQRKIRRAAGERLTYEEGIGDSLVAKFYDLMLMTRRRHGLPAQPVDWFRNIIACLGDKAKVRVASKDGRPIASILTLRYKHVLVYKYGCSDRRFSNLGGTQLLLWNAIQEAKRDQLCEFDMGRSACDNSGLAAFKDRWGADRTTLVYRRYPVRLCHSITEIIQARVGKYVWSHVPSGVLAAAGRLVYKYIG